MCIPAWSAVSSCDRQGYENAITSPSWSTGRVGHTNRPPPLLATVAAGVGPLAALAQGRSTRPLSRTTKAPSARWATQCHCQSGNMRLLTVVVLALVAASALDPLLASAEGRYMRSAYCSCYSSRWIREVMRCPRKSLFSSATKLAGGGKSSTEDKEVPRTGSGSFAHSTRNYQFRRGATSTRPISARVVT